MDRPFIYVKRPCAKQNGIPIIRFTVVAEPVAPSDPVYVSLDSLRLAYIDWLRNQTSATSPRAARCTPVGNRVSEG